MKDMRISTRLMAGFALMGLLILALGSVSLLKSAELKTAFDLVTNERMPRRAVLNVVDQEHSEIAIAMREMLLLETEAERQQRKQTMLTIRAKIGAELQQLAQDVQSARGKELLADVVAGEQGYVAAQDQFLALVDAQDEVAARQLLFVQARPALQAFNQAVKALKRFQDDLLDEAVAHADAGVRSIQTSVAIAILVALVVAVLLALRTTRAITGPLNQAVQVAQAVAAGDLSLQFQARGRSETAQLLLALQQMLHSLREVVGQVRNGSASVASASSQIAQANLDLSSRTEEQASALEQTAASMEELSATVKHNAENAHQANQLAKSASEVAARGGAMVDGVVDTMHGINDSSHRIADIIGVIDSIAFQTNILALNAAVEAARAGEQGRGFAVVASEVRTLAGRSADAAREIKGLITDSVQRVERGTEQVNQTGATMQEIVTAIRRVTDLMGEISAASREQSTGVGQVSEAVTQMDQVTQQNAALVEEMAAAANSLQGQAQELVGSVAVFRMGDEGLEPARKRSAPGASAQAALSPAAPLPRLAG